MRDSNLNITVLNKRRQVTSKNSADNKIGDAVFAMFTNNMKYFLSTVATLARFIRPTWGPFGVDKTQVGPMLAPLNFAIWGHLIHLKSTIT